MKTHVAILPSPVFSIFLILGMANFQLAVSQENQDQGPVTVVTKDNKQYSNVRYQIRDNGLFLFNSEGMTVVPYDQLPDDLSEFPKDVQDVIRSKQTPPQPAPVDGSVISFTTKSGLTMENVSYTLGQTGIVVHTHSSGDVTLPYDQIDLSSVPADVQLRIAKKRQTTSGAHTAENASSALPGKITVITDVIPTSIKTTVPIDANMDVEGVTVKAGAVLTPIGIKDNSYIVPVQIRITRHLADPLHTGTQVYSTQSVPAISTDDLQDISHMANTTQEVNGTGLIPIDQTKVSTETVNIGKAIPKSDLEAQKVVKDNIVNYGGASMLVTKENDIHTFREKYSDVSIDESTVSWTVHRFSGDQEVANYKELLDLSEIIKGSFHVESSPANHEVEANVTYDHYAAYKIVASVLRNRGLYNLRGDPGQYLPTFEINNKDEAYKVTVALNTLTENVKSKQADYTTVPDDNRFSGANEKEILLEQAQRIASCPCAFCESKIFESFELPPSDPIKKNIFGNDLVYSVPLLDRKNAFTVAIDSPVGKYTGVILVLIPNDYKDYSDSEKIMWQLQDNSFIQYVTGLQNGSDIIKRMLDASKAVRSQGWYFAPGNLADNLFILFTPETNIKNYENALSLDPNTLNP